MPKANKNKNIIMIIGAAIFLVLVGLFLYKSMLTAPDINKVTTGEIGGVFKKPANTGHTVPKPKDLPLKP